MAPSPKPKPKDRPEMVARRLASDPSFRARCRQGLREATAGGGRVLDRVKRLNDFLATGLVLEEDEEPQPGGAPVAYPQHMPWETPAVQAPPSQPPEAQLPVPPPQPPPPHIQPQPASPEDSDVEECGEAALLLAAQRAAEQQHQKQAAAAGRAQAAALTIQRHYRRHRAQCLLCLLRDLKQASDRLAARVIQAAYRGACGQRRRLAGAALARQLAALRQRRRRQRQAAVRQAAVRQAGRCGGAAPVAKGRAGAACDESQLCSEEQPPRGTATPQQQSHSAKPAAAASGVLAVPQGALIGRVPTPLPPSVAPLSPGLPATQLLPRPWSGGIVARGHSPALAQHRASMGPCYSSCSGSGSGSGSGGSSRQATPGPPGSSLGSCGSGFLPPASPGRRAGSSQQRELYRRTSSIQLLEAVQLGLDDQEGSWVASQAALEASERTQDRAQELQRRASLGRPPAGGAAAAGTRIARTCSGLQRQASRAHWSGVEAIQE
ncbi:hypothetical protein CHLNCDRAFT_138909 [Chlorella variabilis]|uniref:Uncharacterized protein n=1 Tax=Chlorella variabilis TaxID=554065 RepID=E1ZNX0_CHLVA|nr:hypothetical protein CHLNCDRAFT_138909 [Chlorella variabilis]EFN52417.1 hypothetical protein CHLNCDRAFT_138909 [Chlorella variabilis]|eukprot:XP_005844519.1 hypothetical protein CHLNCDRAFT_138909 [Chlorella variabilis]